MTNLKSKKRMAASVLGVGINKIRFNDVDGDKLEDAITRGSIRALVKQFMLLLKKAFLKVDI